VGDRGWGDFVTNGSSCGEAVDSSTAPPTNFQQNACSTNQWINENYNSANATSLEVIELEEAFADMFLNWVYRTLDQGGFRNINRNGDDDALTDYAVAESLGANIPASMGPGDDRYFWMDMIINNIIR
jgi:hypothetical protein